jgi:O-acetyl-ADP-ribose deacetylase (regulator of RNase III)
MNAAREIADLFANGIGNNGRNLYDLANGATEYWTSGNGTGRKANLASRVYRSQLGSAAEHKRNFIAMLAGSERVTMFSRGQEAVRQAVLAN